MRLGSWSKDMRVLALAALVSEACAGEPTPQGRESPKPATQAPTKSAAPTKSTAPTPATQEPTKSAVPTPVPTPAPSPAAPGPVGPDSAVVVTAEGIVALDEAGQRARIVAPLKDVSWCRVDPLGRAVWARHDEAGALSVIDLESEGAAPAPVLAQVPDTVVITYPSGALDEPEGFDFEDGVKLHVAAAPRAEALVGCEGDLEYSCFDDVERAPRLRIARRKKLQQTLGAQTLQSGELLATLAKRATGYRPLEDAAASTRPAPTRVLTVPSGACSEDEESCGTAKAVPVTPYWLVEVSNSRGDFFHSTHQLYDPKTTEFFDPRDPKARSPKPLAEGAETFTPRWVSPSGTLALGDDTLVKLEGGTLASGLTGICGFWGGGWRSDWRGDWRTDGTSP